MRRSDILFFGTILLVLLLILIMVIFDVHIPYVTYFWWILLSPYIFVKIFFQKSKLFAWFNKEVCCYINKE